jgi:hypothetical protein
VTVSPGAAKKQTSGLSSRYEGGVDHPSGPLGRPRPVSGCPGPEDIAERLGPGKGCRATAAEKLRVGFGRDPVGPRSDFFGFADDLV